jgi:hypothetical protein
LPARNFLSFDILIFLNKQMLAAKSAKLKNPVRLEFEIIFLGGKFMSQIYYDVPLIPQGTTLTCWWAAARMIIEYHRRQQQQTTLAGGAVGQPDETGAVESANQPLQPDRAEDFARLANLRMTYLSPTPESLVSLLTQKGPLWYGGVAHGYRGYPGGGHVVVITGCIISPAGAQVSINDPWRVNQGARLFEVFDDFFRTLSAAAPFLHI